MGTARDVLTETQAAERARYGLADEEWLGDHLRTLLGSGPLDLASLDPGELEECSKILHAVASARENAKEGEVPIFAMTRGGGYSVLFDARSVVAHVEACRRQEHVDGVDKAAAGERLARLATVLAETLGQQYAADEQRWKDDRAELESSPLLEELVSGTCRPKTRAEAEALYTVEALDLLLYDPNQCIAELWEDERPDLALLVNQFAATRSRLLREDGLTCDDFPQPDYRAILEKGLGDAARERLRPPEAVGHPEARDEKTQATEERN